MDTRWKHPFTCVVAGPTGCDKTTFVTRLLRHALAMIDAPPEKMTWCYGEWQSAYASMNMPNLQLEEGLPNAPLHDPKTRNLIVIDDLMAEADGRVTTLFTKRVTTVTYPSSISCRTCFLKTKKVAPSA